MRELICLLVQARTARLGRARGASSDLILFSSTALTSHSKLCPLLCPVLSPSSCPPPLKKLDGDPLIITEKDTMDIHSLIHLTKMEGNFKDSRVLRTASQGTESYALRISNLAQNLGVPLSLWKLRTSSWARKMFSLMFLPLMKADWWGPTNSSSTSPPNFSIFYLRARCTIK